MLRKISFVLLAAALAASFGLWFEHYQFWQESVQAAESNCRSGGICFAAHGPHTYEVFAARYGSIFGLLLIFLAGKIIRAKTVSIALCLASALLMFYQFWQIYGFYSMLIEMFSDYETTKTFELLRESVPRVGICFLLILALSAARIATFLAPPSRMP